MHCLALLRMLFGGLLPVALLGSLTSFKARLTLFQAPAPLGDIHLHVALHGLDWESPRFSGSLGDQNVPHSFSTVGLFCTD